MERRLAAATLRAMGVLLHSMRELAVRSGDGIEVRLLWCGRQSRLAVQVDDARRRHAFTLEVREGERAMDVFHHPYAYAAWHGVAVEPVAEDAGPRPHRLAA